MTGKFGGKSALRCMFADILEIEQIVITDNQELKYWV